MQIEERLFCRYPNAQLRLSEERFVTALRTAADSLHCTLPKEIELFLKMHHGLQLINVLEFAVPEDDEHYYPRLTNLRFVGFYDTDKPSNTFDKMVVKMHQYQPQLLMPQLFPLAVAGPLESPTYCVSCRDRDFGQVFRKVSYRTQIRANRDPLYEPWSSNLASYLESLRTFNYDDQVSDYLILNSESVHSVADLPPHIAALPWRE